MTQLQPYFQRLDWSGLIIEICKSLFQGVFGESGQMVDSELLHYSLPMGFDRPGADMMEGGNFFRGLPFGNQLQDFSFA